MNDVVCGLTGDGRSRNQRGSSTVLRGFLASGLLMLSGAALTGCSLHQAPHIEVVKAQYMNSSDEASLIEYTIAVSNPISEPMPLNDFRYTVSFDGLPVFSTRRAAEATIRRLGVQTVLLPAIIPGVNLALPPEGTHDIAIRGTLTYTVPGQLAELLLDTGARVPTVHFQDSRKVDFSHSKSLSAPLK